jgi:tetrahydrodipicolinate N-succinyltransferase
MKKLILGLSFLFIAVLSFAQSSEISTTANDILKYTAEEFAEKTQNELNQVCNLKADQSQKVYEIALKTAKTAHGLAEHNATNTADDYAMKLNTIVSRGEAYIVNILDKNQVAAYNKKERILNKEQLIKDRQARAKAHNEAKAARATRQ